MAETTKIEWTDATFNPWVGCTKISPACYSCYASVSTPARAMRIEWGAGKPRHRTSEATWRQPLLWERQHEKFFAEHGRRRRVFCASLADVFDNEVDPQWRADLMQLILRTKHLDWLLLTKRVGNVESMVAEAGDLIDYGEGFQSLWGQGEWPTNVWLGATIANQAEADRDIPKLLSTPAGVRFLSCEPLLGPIDLNRIVTRASDAPERGKPDLSMSALRGWFGGAGNPARIDWVIAGGESGPKARPSHPDWFRSLRDQCKANGVAFHWKQHGEWAPEREGDGATRIAAVGSNGEYFDGFHRERTDDAIMSRVGKKAAGRTLAGRLHDDFPTTERA